MTSSFNHQPWHRNILRRRRLPAAVRRDGGSESRREWPGDRPLSLSLSLSLFRLAGPGGEAPTIAPEARCATSVTTPSVVEEEKAGRLQQRGRSGRCPHEDRSRSGRAASRAASALRKLGSSARRSAHPCARSPLVLRMSARCPDGGGSSLAPYTQTRGTQEVSAIGGTTTRAAQHRIHQLRRSANRAGVAGPSRRARGFPARCPPPLRELAGEGDRRPMQRCGGRRQPSMHCSIVEQLAVRLVRRAREVSPGPGSGLALPHPPPNRALLA